MGFLKNIIRNAVSDGVSKGIRDAVEKAAESIVAPKAEAYANKVAESFDKAAGEVSSASTSPDTAEKNKSGLASLEASLEKLSQSAERYAATIENATATSEDLAKMWNEKVPGFPLWCFGGTDFWFDEFSYGEGDTCYTFCADNATPEGLELYIELLKKNGFVRKFSSSDEVLYKDLGGEYLIIGFTTAFEAAPVMTLSMVRTKDRSEIEI